MLDYPREPTSVIFHISTYKMMHGVVQQPIHLKARFCVGVSQTPIFHKIIRRDRRGVDSRIIAVLFLQSYGNFRSHRTRRRPRKTRIDDMRCSARRLHVMEARSSDRFHKPNKLLDPSPGNIDRVCRVEYEQEGNSSVPD